MRHFNAVIKVNEDAEFRKTVLDAIRSETREQIQVFLKVSLGEFIRKFIEDNKELVTEMLRSEIHKATYDDIMKSQKYNDLYSESYSYIKEKFNESFSDERLERILEKSFESYFRKRL